MCFLILLSICQLMLKTFGRRLQISSETNFFFPVLVSFLLGIAGRVLTSETKLAQVMARSVITSYFYFVLLTLCCVVHTNQSI